MSLTDQNTAPGAPQPETSVAAHPGTDGTVAEGSTPGADQQPPGLRLTQIPVPDALAERGIDGMLVFSTPLTQKFRHITVREGMLLHGPAGWGEFSPFWDYEPAESATWLLAGVDGATQTLPAPRRNYVPVNVTVPVMEPEAAHDLVAASGCTTAKVKVAEPGVPLEADLARVEAVRDALGDDGLIRVDANGAWSTVAADRAIAELDRAAHGLEYVEQPCRTVEEMATLRRHIHVPLAADEAVRRSADPLAVVKAEAADYLVIKAQPLGGVKRALDLVEQAGLPAIVSSALDTSVGIALGARLAACLPTLEHACGLGTLSLLTGDVSVHSRLPHDGVVAVDRATVDQAIDADPASDPYLSALAGRWSQRLDATLTALTQQEGH